MKMLFSKLAASTAILTVVMSCVGRVSADVAVTYTVNVTGIPQTFARPGFTPPKYPLTIKTYFTPTKARVESEGGSTVIYDLAGSQTYTLDPVKKTYYVQPLSAQGGRGGMNASATLQPTGETKTVKAVTASRYSLNGSVSFGNFGGGGGFTPPTLTGDVWFSDSAPLPDGSTTAVPEVSIFTAGGQMFARSLSDAILQIKRVPISGKVTFTAAFPGFNGGAATNLDMVETFFASSISTSPIGSDLFSPPASYSKVDPPQRPAWGGQGGPGGGRGGRGGGFGGGGFGGGQGGGGNAGGPGADNGGVPPPQDNGGGNTN